MLAAVLLALMGRRLHSVARFAWHSDDGSLADLNLGSVHLWFEGGLVVHLSTGTDWTLRWSVSEPGDGRWLDQYQYDFHGRWLKRDVAHEEPFVGIVGSRLSSVTPTWNEVNEIVGVTLTFGDQSVALNAWASEIDTSPR